MNSEYRGDSDIGRLMHDFHCTNAADMALPIDGGANTVLKGKPEGSERIENIRNLTETMGLTIEQAMAALKVPEDERQKYKDLLEQEDPKE